LVLHNSFDLLNQDCDLFNVEVILEEHEPSMLSADGNFSIYESSIVVSKGTVCLELGKDPEGRLSNESRPFASQSCVSNKQVLDPVSRRLSYPNTCPSSPMHSNIARRLLFPIVT